MTTFFFIVHEHHYRYNHYKLQVYTHKLGLNTPSHLQQRNHTKMMELSRIILFIVFIQAAKMEIEPCANSMWTQSVINDCYAGQMEHIEGHARLSLQMTLQKPYIFVNHCQCHLSKSEQLMLWCNLTSCLLLSLAILDESVRTLSEQFNRIKQFLE